MASKSPSRKRKAKAAPTKRLARVDEPALLVSHTRPSELTAIRDLFWHNVVREMLAGLAGVALKHPDVMDGRFALLTHGGERVPIARVEPVFACTVSGARRATSAAVQMTVFRITTPDGEVFTLPVQEVRAFHELTPELLSRIAQTEADDEGAAENVEPRPFGFAAFKALPQIDDRPLPPAPMHPTE